jgi:hypothetical protein
VTLQPISLTLYAVRCFPGQDQGELQNRIKTNSDIRTLFNPVTRAKIYKSVLNQIKDIISTTVHDRITKGWIEPTEKDLIFIASDLEYILQTEKGKRIIGIQKANDYLREGIAYLNAVKLSYDEDIGNLRIEEKFELSRSRSSYLNKCAEYLKNSCLQIQIKP